MGLPSVRLGGSREKDIDGARGDSEREFISLEGGGLSKHVDDTITMTCTKNNDTVLRDASTVAGYGAYFTLGPTATWTGGSAVCTAQLVKYSKSGSPRVLDQFSFVVSG